MLTFGFYNSKNGDRKYDAEQIGAMFNGLITDGVFANYKEALRVTSGNEKKEIIVHPGRAWFNGTWTEVDDGGHSIRLGTSFAADDTFYICLAVYKKSRVNSIAYYTDIPENNPDTGLYYYLLAQINVPAGSDRVTDSMITDMRGSDHCPYVTGIMETVSFEELVKQVCGDSWKDWLGAYEAGITTGVQNAVATSELALDEVRSMKSYAVESEDVSYIWAKFEAVPTGGGGFEWVTDSVHTELTDPPMPVCLFRDLSYADLGPGFKPSVSLSNPYIDYGETSVKAIPAITQSKVWREYPYFWEGGADNGTDVLRYDHLQRVVVNVGGTASEKYSYRTSRLMRIPVVYEPGAYIGTVDADNATAYPKDGYRDGYYYIRFASRAEDVSFYYPGLSAKNVRDAIVEVVNTGGTGSGTAMSVIEVEELPSTGIKGVFYIVKKPGDSDASEYLWLDRWEKVGGTGSAQNAVLYTEQELTSEQQEQARKNIGAISITAGITTQGKITKFYATGGKIQFNDTARGCFFNVKENTLYKITVKGEHNRFYIGGSMLEEILNNTACPTIYNSERNTVTTETETYTINSGNYKSFMVTVCFGMSKPNVSVEYTEVGGGTVNLDEIEVYTAKKVDQLMSGAVMHVEQSLTEDQKVQARENIGAVGVKTFDPVQYEPSHYFVNMNTINYSTNGLGCFIKVKENTLYKVTVKGEHNRFFINGCMLDEVQTGAEAPTIYSSGLSDVTTETETYTFNSAGYKSIMVTVAYGLTNPVISVEIVETTDGIIDFDGTEVYTSEKVDRLIAPLVIDGLVYTTPSDLDGVTKTEEVYALYDALVTKHPAYVAKNVLGQNSEGTDICEYVFTAGDYNAVDALRTKDPVIPKPTVLVISGIHGDERSAVKSTYQFFRDLANFSPILYQLREGVTFKVIPVATPGALDRGKRVNENGVNVNRNFDYEWSATANDGMNYAGAAATDQAETQILQAWFGENESAALLVDHHNSGYPNEVSMVYGNESEMMPEIKRLYLQGTARVIPYWKTKKGFPDDLIFAYTGYLNAGGVLIDYAQYGKGIPSICMETSWNQNSLGKHSAETVAVGAEALGNMLLAMYDKFESLRSRNLSQDGENGFSPIATVSQTADGATITITDKNGTTTATLTNGRNGNAGGYYVPLVTQPKPGVVQFVWKASEEEMQPAPPIGVELPEGPQGTAGKDGGTPVKGVDYYTEGDKAELVAMVLNALDGKVISGYVDSDNNIIISGLSDGSYNVRYEKADGSTIDIGALEVGSVGPAYTNLAEPNPDNTTDYTIWCSEACMSGDGTLAAREGYTCTNFFALSNGDVIRIKGFKIERIGLYNADKTPLPSGVGNTSALAANSYVKADHSQTDDFTTFTANSDRIAYARLSGWVNGTAAEVVITRNEEIA